MAQSHQTGNPLVTAKKSITDLLAAPLSPDWTVEGLAEQLLGAIAVSPPEAVGEVQALVLVADATTDRQSRRMLRPLLACLATKSAAEAGTPVNLFTGHLCFKRPGPAGPVWITGEFENRPGAVRVAFRLTARDFRTACRKECRKGSGAPDLFSSLRCPRNSLRCRAANVVQSVCAHGFLPLKFSPTSHPAPLPPGRTGQTSSGSLRCRSLAVGPGGYRTGKSG
jgi:hypothetical protein